MAEIERPPAPAPPRPAPPPPVVANDMMIC
jgi:hypothetical protein